MAIWNPYLHQLPWHKLVRYFCWRFSGVTQAEFTACRNSCQLITASVLVSGQFFPLGNCWVTVAPNDNSLPGFFTTFLRLRASFLIASLTRTEASMKSIQLDVHEPGAPQLHGSFQWLIISLVVNSSPTPSAYPPKRIISPPRSSNFRAGGGTFAAPF